MPDESASVGSPSTALRRDSVDSKSTALKKRKMSEDEPKKMSCTACRRRKIRCEPTPAQVTELGGEVGPCLYCISKDAECIYTAGKKRGRPPKAKALDGSTLPLFEPHSELSQLSLPPSLSLLLNLPSPDLDPMLVAGPSTLPSSYVPLENSFLGGGDSTNFLLNDDEGRRTSVDSVPKVHRVEDVLSRETATYIISLFFDYVHALTPCIHRPSFYADFAARKEETSPLFFALLMATLAATLAQVPWSFVPVQQDQVRKLATQCYLASLNAAEDCFETASTSMVIIQYFHSIYHFTAQREGKNNACFGAAQQIALSLHMHREEAYAGLDPIDCEMRRRIFYLLFGSDKTKTAIGGRLVTMPTRQCRSVALPAALDDECITAEGYLPQPASRVPVIVGFCASVSTYSIVGEIWLLQHEVEHAATSHTGPVVAAHLQHVHRLSAALDQTAEELPSEFSVQHAPTAPDYKSPDEGWDDEVRRQMEVFFTKPEVALQSPRDGYLVSAANLCVTIALVRFTLLTYRDIVLDLAGPPGSPPRIAAAREACLDLDGPLSTKDGLAIDLLISLHRLPIHAVAVSTTSLVDRVRFIAATLLEGDKVQDERMASYLWAYLGLLNDIERNISKEAN